MAIDKHRGIHRAGRRARKAVDSKPRLLEQTIKHAPRECPMRASALQRTIDKDGIVCDCGLGWFHWYLTSRKSLGRDFGKLKTPAKAISRGPGQARGTRRRRTP